MNLETAQSYLKPFTQDGSLKTPSISDDWTLSFNSNYAGDQIVISSEDLNTSVLLEISISSFFIRHIFSKDILLDGDKLVGEFAFYSFDILTKESFLEAFQMVEDKNNEEPLSNDNLIEYGVYLDDRNVEQVYLGHFGLSSYSLNTSLNGFYKETKKSKMYMIKYSSNKNTNKVIIKTNKKKFFSLVRILSLEEILKLKKDLLSFFYSTSLLSKDGSNVIDIFEEDTRDNFIGSGFYTFNGRFGYLSRYNYADRRIYFLDFDIELLKTDLINNTLDLNYSKYIISEDRDFDMKIFKQSSDIKKLSFFADYQD